jgi:hypothetical protein
MIIGQNPMRRQIEKIIEKWGYLALEDFDGVKIVELRDSRRDLVEDILCYHFVFGGNWKDFIDPVGEFPSENPVRGHEQIPCSERREGDVAAYLIDLNRQYVDESTSCYWLHWGRVSDDPDRVVSKWCHESVVKHPLHFVFPEYGEGVRFFRPVSEEAKLQAVP